MKRLLSLAAIATVVSVFISCSGEKNSMAGRPQVLRATDQSGLVKDNVTFYDEEIKAKQRSYKKELMGQWNIVVMHRQQRAVPEDLSNVTLIINDSTFTGKAPCNNMGGHYTLKGTSIKFSDIYSTKMACSNLEQEAAFIKLMEETVSAYSVSDSKLLLRDGSSNIVFECVRSN